MALFDVLVDLTEHAIPPGLPPAVAMERVRVAIEAMAGAGSVTVTWQGGKPPGQPWVEIHRPEVGYFVWSDEAGERLTKLVRAEARRAFFPSLTAARITEVG